MSDSEDSQVNLSPDDARQLWDSAAANFDNAPDHGLHDPVVRVAWTSLLQNQLAPVRTDGKVLDIGCGTGSLSIVLAELGYRVTGIDLSPAMLTIARAKARQAGHDIDFLVMDAAFPQFPPRQFEAILCRHLLWTLPQIDQVLQRWTDLLKPGGRVLLIEGFWHTGTGLRAEQIVQCLHGTLSSVAVHHLSSQAELWGGVVADDRYAITADRHV